MQRKTQTLSNKRDWNINSNKWFKSSYSFKICLFPVSEISEIFNSCHYKIYPLGGDKELTVGDVAAESKGKIPPQAMMILSTIWEMRCIVLCTKIMFSLLLTKSITDFVEWLKQRKEQLFISSKCKRFRYFE